MGNRNSNSIKKNPKSNIKPASKKTPIPATVIRRYSPPVVGDKRNHDSAMGKIPEEPAPLSARRQQSYSPRIRQITPVVPVLQSSSLTDEEHSSPIILRRPVTLAPTAEQSFSVLVPKPMSPVSESEYISSPLQDTPMPDITNYSVNANSLERAPIIRLNYVARSSDNSSIHTYGPGNITVMHRTSSQSIPNGNRWYDYDYNKNGNH